MCERPGKTFPHLLVCDAKSLCPVTDAHPSAQLAPLLSQNHFPGTTGSRGMELIDVPRDEAYTHEEEWWVTNSCVLIVEVEVNGGSPICRRRHFCEGLEGEAGSSVPFPKIVGYGCKRMSTQEGESKHDSSIAEVEVNEVLVQSNNMHIT